MYTPRRKYILTFLEQNHEGSISELAQKLNVSSMTIRRDIEFLAKQGLVTQIRGGVTLNHGAAFLHSQSLRKTLHINEKYRIAKYCAELIPEGSSIFIDCGSTTNQIAKEILQKLRDLGIAHANNLDQSVVTASAGVYAARPTADVSVTALIQRADVALYAAKSDGRNRVFCFDTERSAAVAV